MTSTNFTIDNINPLIIYNPAALWTEGSKTLDPLASSYSNGGTFTLCTTKDSSASFTFNGTQVFVHGAKRSNHGPYSVTLDGTTTLFDGFSQDAIFGTLFVSPILNFGTHTVKVTNQLNDTNLPFLDIDFITWTTIVSASGQTTAKEDTDPAFTYQPATQWGTDLSSAVLTGFSSNNGHVTQATGASASLAFTGSSIAVFGSVGPTLSPYTVTLDGIPAGSFNATKQDYTAQVALYSASNLGDGNHTIELKATPASPGQFFAIDFANVVPADALGSTTSVSSGAGTSTSAPTRGIIVLALLVLFLFLLRRRGNRSNNLPSALGNDEDKFYAQPPPPAPTPYVAPANNYTRTSLSSSAAHSNYDSNYSSQTNLVGGQYAASSSASASSPPPVPALRNPWSTTGHSSDNNVFPGQRTFRTVNGSSSASEPDRDHEMEMEMSSVYSSGAAGLGAGGGNRSRKDTPLPLPPTANMPLPIGTSRMFVPGREQDFGPLPPDYEQATEPYRGA
ncbi:hypothetical protein FB45DRAFT_754920 [Roridomyces roridus]|uniref:Transmembrane protein n=1 Tax=Roridomyces roridus TaxID=1738132 RepID=A0AAD7FEK6_9AGAR|nr:hypothetical protein FB45DRAFT_754920 [Roridomyces roridus]